MKAVFVLFDSLNRHVLGALRRHAHPHAEFRPAGAARRDLRPPLCRQPALHAGAARHADRPAELPAPQLGAARAVRQLLPRDPAERGVYSHLVTDHFHYFEDGGATYHNRYDSYEFIRGQEGDAWKAMVQPHWERLREMYHERQFSDRARATTARTTSSTASSSARRRTSPRSSASPRRWSSSTATATPTTGCCSSRPSIRTSPSTRPRASRAFRPAGTGRSATGRATAASTSCRRNARSCAPTTTRWWRCATSCSGELLDYFDAARPVEGHRAGRLHRPRLPARRARFLGEEPDEHVRGDRRTSRSSSIIRARRRGRRRGGGADPDDRSRADLPRHVRRARRRPRCKGISLLPVLEPGPSSCARARCSAISAAR